MRKAAGMLVVALPIALVMGGCAAGGKHVVQHKTAPVRLVYTPQHQGGLEGKAIGLIQYEAVQSKRPEVASRQQIPLFAAPGMMRTPDPTMDPALTRMFEDAFQRDLMAILTSEKAQVFGPYESYDEIPYGEKSKTLVVIEPKFSVSLISRVTKRERVGSSMYKEQGVFEGSVRGVIKLREPLTGEVVLVKRIRATVISKPWVYNYEVQQSNQSAVGALFDLVASSNFKKYDDRIARRNEMISALYQEMMKKVEAALDPQEILAHQAEIEKLKALKRF